MPKDSAAPATPDVPSVFKPIRTKRGYEHIVEQVRTGITSGELKPGDRLPAEREMASLFGVSRQGVREAVRGLESTGLVEVRLGVLGGVFVRSGDAGTVARAMTDLASLGGLSSEGLLEARIILSTAVVRLACERATEDDYRRLDEDIAVVEAESGDRRSAQITDFYRLLAMATHNEVLVMLMDSLAQIVYSRLVRTSPDPNPQLGEIRRHIVDHMRAGRVDEAIDGIREHLVALEVRMVEAESRAAARAAAPTD